MQLQWKDDKPIKIQKQISLTSRNIHPCQLQKGKK